MLNDNERIPPEILTYMHALTQYNTNETEGFFASVSLEKIEAAILSRCKDDEQTQQQVDEDSLELTGPYLSRISRHHTLCYVGEPMQTLVTALKGSKDFISFTHGTCTYFLRHSAIFSAQFDAWAQHLECVMQCGALYSLHGVGFPPWLSDLGIQVTPSVLALVNLKAQITQFCADDLILPAYETGRLFKERFDRSAEIRSRRGAINVLFPRKPLIVETDSRGLLVTAMTVPSVKGVRYQVAEVVPNGEVRYLQAASRVAISTSEVLHCIREYVDTLLGFGYFNNLI